MNARYIFASLLSVLGMTLQAQKIEIAGIQPSPDGGLDGRMIIAKADGGSKQIKALDLVCFRLRNGQSTTFTTGITPMPDGYYLIQIPALDRSFEVPYIDTTDRYAYRIGLTTDDNVRIVTEMIEDNGLERFYWIGSDVKWTSYTQGEIGPKVDQALGGWNPFIVADISFYKSFSVHGKGSFTFDFPADNPYSRFFTYYGIQDDRSGGDVRFSFIVNGETLETHDMYSKSNPSKPTGYDGIYLRKFETPINGKTKIVLDGDVIDDAAYDHMNFPMGRVYLKPDTRKPQKAGWPSVDILASDKPFAQTIDAAFPSGGTAYYEIVSGSEYATISGAVLNVHTIPEDKDAYIEVRAYQFGTDEYLPAPPSTCRFYIRNNKTVARGEKLELNGGDVVDQLTVYADPESRGQVVVSNGYAQVKKLILKYTFRPGEWNFITFPANMNLDRVSNLNELGYKFNDNQKAYFICEYNTRQRAENPEKTAWTQLASPDVVRNKGYIMGVSRSADNPDNTPVEVTFTFENTTLGVDASGDGSMNVELDMMQVKPGTTVPVYVEPDGVKGAPLKVMVTFSPKDLSQLPVNYAAALDEARITFIPDRSGIRLTLPTQDPAKVVIFDRKDRIVKAVSYTAPYVIDIRTLKPGEYRAYIQYGNASAVKPFTVEKK